MANLTAPTTALTTPAAGLPIGSPINLPERAKSTTTTDPEVAPPSALDAQVAPPSTQEAPPSSGPEEAPTSAQPEAPTSTEEELPVGTPLWVPAGLLDLEQPSASTVTVVPGPPGFATPSTIEGNSYWVQDVNAAKHLLQQYALASGFVATQYTRSRYRTYFQCSKSGFYTCDGVGIRKSTAGKTNCKFRAVIIVDPLRVDKMVEVSITCPSHNHPSFKTPTSHPSVCRLGPSEEHFIWSLHRSHIKNQQIVLTLREHYPGWGNNPGPFEYIRVADVKNIIAKIKLSLSDGLMATQEMVRSLQENDYWYHIKNDDLGRLQYICFAFKWSIEMWKNHWRILSINCTHDITTHKMKLCEVVGRTAVKTHFPIFYALGAEENNDFMDWAMGLLRNLADENNIPAPHVYITDNSDAERHGLGEAFPESDRQLCTFHIKKAFLRYLTKHWAGDSCEETAKLLQTRLENPPQPTVIPLEDLDTWEPEAGCQSRYKPQQFEYSFRDCFALFEAIVDVPIIFDKIKLEERWNELFRHEQPVIELYYRGSLKPAEEQFMNCYTKDLRNYGIVTTNDAESAHYELRQLLPNASTCTFIDLFAVCHSVNGKKKRQFDDHTEQHRASVRNEHRRNPLLVAVTGKIAAHALELVHKQWLFAIKNIVGQELPKAEFCTFHYKYQLGLPCCHSIARLYKMVLDESTGKQSPQLTRPLTMEDFDQQWHLDNASVNGDPLRFLRDPAPKAPKAKVPPHKLAPPKVTNKPAPPRSDQRSSQQQTPQDTVSSATPPQSTAPSEPPALTQGAASPKGTASKQRSRSAGRVTKRGGGKARSTAAIRAATAAALAAAMAAAEATGEMQFIQYAPPIIRAQQAKTTHAQLSSVGQTYEKHTQRIPSGWEEGGIVRGHGGISAITVEAPREFDPLPAGHVLLGTPEPEQEQGDRE